MDDDDEFGDLYTDVLRPFTASHPSILSSSSSFSVNPPKSDLNPPTHTENIIDGGSDLNFTIPSSTANQTHKTKVEQPGNEFLFGETSNSPPNLMAGDILVQVKKENVDELSKNLESVGALETQNGELCSGSARVSEDWDTTQKFGITDVKVEDTNKNVDFIDKGGIFIREEAEEKLEIDMGIDDLGSEPVIPGLSGGPFIPAAFDGGADEGVKYARKEDIGGTSGGGDADGGGDDWDSDSEDDLQIVLNDKSGPLGMDRNEGMGSDDEDGEDLVIVADGDQPHQPMEDQDWGDDPTQMADGERKEAGESAKANGGVVNTGGTRIGYGNHAYPSHHSQFKYVRPGAAVVPGGAIAGPGGAPGQVRPLVSMGLAVRGRGDWRPMGIKTAPGMQRPFHSGFGLPAWGNNSSGRGFGSGLDFTLPSHKTVFDIDIDSFEEKPWRNPGVDLSDFFNFGLDEENWKDYSKQLEQLRLEATMQSRIRVYESGRSEQDYDPDLPPELAAAAGIQDASAENAHVANTECGLSDLTGQGRGALRSRPPMIPTGRAIQVEGGYGERLPSIDTRPPRMRDSDAIIEIVLQGSGDDDPMAVDADNDDLKGGDNEEDIEQSEYFDNLPQPYNEAAVQYNPGSKGRAPNYSGGTFGTSPDERRPQGTTRDRYSRQASERGNDGITCESVRTKKVYDNDRVKSDEHTNGEHNPEATSPVVSETVREPSIESKVDLDNEFELADSTLALEGEETAKDMTLTSDTVRGKSPIPSTKRQKLSSRVEQPIVQDIGSVDGLRATHSSDNSKARSGSSKDYQKRRDGMEEEVVQEGRSRRMKRRRDEDDHNFQRKDAHGRDGRHEMDRSRVFAKGKEDSHISYPYRDWDLNPTHISRLKAGDIERSRERDSSIGARQRRDNDSQGRRLKDEDIRKRDHVDEIGYRPRSKVRESEMGDKDDYLHSRKRLDNGDWRVHDKDVGPRHREKDDNLMIRHENFDDSSTRRRKEEEYLRREQTDKEVFHSYRAREDSIRRKREMDDSLEQRKREEQPWLRDKPDDTHSVRHREESWRQRERDERRLKQSHEDTLLNQDREGRNSVRSGRDIEEKSRVGNTRAKDESKVLGSDKDYQYKDKRRPSEHSKRSDRVEDGAFTQHRGRDNVYARENHFVNEDRNPRHERSNTHSDRPVSASDSQLTHKERHRDIRRSKDSDRTDQLTLGSSKRKQEDHYAHRNEKVSRKVTNELESDVIPISGHTSSREPGQSRLSSSASLSKKSSHEHDAPQQRHSSRKHKEDAPSDDEQQNLRRGRSKLERWTSNKDRDDITNSLSTTSSKAKETSRKNIDLLSEVNEQPNDQIATIGSIEDQLPAGDGSSAHDLEVKDAGTELTLGSRQVESDKVGDDRHLDTVAKLKKRSERFKTPMPSEKETATFGKAESESLVSTQNEIAADAEVKPERPARKRRWTSS